MELYFKDEKNREPHLGSAFLLGGNMKLVYLLPFALFFANCSTEVKIVDSRSKVAAEDDGKSSDKDSSLEAKADRKAILSDSKSATEDVKSAQEEGPRFSFEQVEEPVDLNLMSKKVIKYKVIGDSSLESSVDVNLAIDRSAFSTVDTQGDTKITISPAVVSLAAGEEKEVEVTLDVSSMSPSVDSESNAGKFMIMGTSGNQKESLEVPLNIEPKVVIEVRGTAANNLVWTPNITDSTFRVHDGGLMMQWVNMDTQARYVIHGGQGIKHQNTNMRLEPAVGDTPGDSYTAVVNNNGLFYEHNLEADAGNRVTRRIRFVQ